MSRSANVQVAYEYGYGFDGGRRWRKDYVSGVWTRYPCGVACGAGELVEQTSDLSGAQWTTSALYLQGISLVRRNSEWHHFDPLGTAGVITNGTASVISNNLYDVFGVLRYEQGSAQTPWRWKISSQAEEELIYVNDRFAYPARGLTTLSRQIRPMNVIVIGLCAVACVWTVLEIWDRWNQCLSNCESSLTPTTCMLGCLLDACRENLLNGAMCAGCGCCILAASRLPALRNLCKNLWDVVKQVGKQVFKVFK